VDLSPPRVATFPGDNFDPWDFGAPLDDLEAGSSRGSVTLPRSTVTSWEDVQPLSSWVEQYCTSSHDTVPDLPPFWDAPFPFENLSDPLDLLRCGDIEPNPGPTGCVDYQLLPELFTLAVRHLRCPTPVRDAFAPPLPPQQPLPFVLDRGGRRFLL